MEFWFGLGGVWRFKVVVALEVAPSFGWVGGGRSTTGEWVAIDEGIFCFDFGRMVHYFYFPFSVF